MAFFAVCTSRSVLNRKLSFLCTLNSTHAGMFLVIPLVSAFTGWIISRILISILFYPAKPIRLFGFTWSGMFSGSHSLIYKKLESLTKQHLFSPDEILQFALSPETFQKILPTIETHIDHFLKVTLKEKMPMVGSLIGERTTSQMKTIFMDELEVLFPVIIKDYSTHLLSDPGITRKIREKLNTIPAAHMKVLVFRLFSNELRIIQWIGVIAGLLIGVIQLLTSLIFYP